MNNYTDLSSIIKNKEVLTQNNKTKLNKLYSVIDKAHQDKNSINIFYSPEVSCIYPGNLKNNTQTLSFTNNCLFFIGASLSKDNCFHIYSNNKDITIDTNIENIVLRNSDTISRIIYNIKEALEIANLNFGALNIFVDSINIDDKCEYFTLLILKAINYFFNDNNIKDEDLVKASIWSLKNLVSVCYNAEKIVTPILTGVIEYQKDIGSYGKAFNIQDCTFFKEYYVYDVKLKKQPKQSNPESNLTKDIDINKFYKLSKAEIVETLKNQNKTNKTILDVLFLINQKNQDNKIFSSFKKATYTQFIKFINIKENERSFYNTDNFYNSEIYKLLYMIFKDYINSCSLSIITNGNSAVFFVSRDVLISFKTVMELFKDDINYCLIKPSLINVDRFPCTTDNKIH